MKTTHRSSFVIITVFAFALGVLALAGAASAQGTDGQGRAHLSFPGEYVRRVANDQAVVNLGYRTANGSVGQNWLMIEISMTVVQQQHDLEARGFLAHHAGRRQGPSRHPGGVQQGASEPCARSTPGRHRPRLPELPPETSQHPVPHRLLRRRVRRRTRGLALSRNSA